ncbi:MAG: cytochrome c [Vicinamibacteria bacterium]|nr:cytochrome c [Vicinamibacteria bacterium]
MSSISARRVLGAVTLSLLAAPPALSMPRLMDLYNAHPRSVPQNRDKCVMCHTNANGSGKLTTFGHKYEEDGLQFTESLMKEYPNLFQTASVPATSGGGANSPSNPPPPSETNGHAEPPVWSVAAYFRAECQKCHGKLGDGDPLQGVPAWATKQWLDTRSDKKAELVNIILLGKDKMIGHAGKITEAQAVELYVFIVEIAKKYS